MKAKCVFKLAVVLACLLGSTACRQGPSVNNLSQGLGFLPANSAHVYFTDWSLIKKYKGVSDLNSQSSLDKRKEFMLATSKDQALGSGFGIGHFMTHAQVWGWDSTDLVWEMSTEAGVPAYVLKFRDDFDFAPVQALFEQRGFVKGDYLGKTIYSHEASVDADWLRATDLSILNAALLPEDKALVLASNWDAVQTLIDVRSGKASALRDDKSVQSVVRQLGEVAAAYLSPGAKACTDFGAAALLAGNRSVEAQAAELRELLNKAAQFHAYAALGVGYRYEGSQPVGLIVMDYAAAGDAQSDLEPRRLLAEKGTSLAAKAPYSQALFNVDKVSVEGSSLVLRVAPAGNAPRRLFDMVFRRDMLFAICP